MNECGNCFCCQEGASSANKASQLARNHVRLPGTDVLRGYGGPLTGKVAAQEQRRHLRCQAILKQFFCPEKT